MSRRLGLFVFVLAALFITILCTAVLRRGKNPENPPPRSLPPLTRPSAEPVGQPVEITTFEKSEALTLRIEVVDGASKPVAGARAFNRWHFGTSLAVTGESGFMSFPYSAVSKEDPTAADLRIEHPLFAPQRLIVRPSEENYKVTLKPSAVVEVEVLNTSGQPLAGAEVQVDEVEAGFYSAPYMKRRWKTGETGHLRLTGIPFGALVIRAQAAGYEEGRTFIVAHEGEPRTAKIILTQGRILNVTVRTSNGSPVVDAQVDFSDGSTWGMSSSYMTGYTTRHWRLQTDKDGRASFDNLPASMTQGWLRAKTQKLARHIRQLQLQETTTDVDVTLEPGATLIVDALDPQGRSVSCRVDVSAREFEKSPEPSQFKAAQAKAIFDGLPTASPVDVRVSRDNATIHVEKGILLGPSETRELTIRLPQQCRLKVVARDAQGSPVPGSIEVDRVKGALGPPVSGLPQDYLTYHGAIREDGTGEFMVFVGIYKVRFRPFEGKKVEKEVRVEQDLSVDLEVASELAITGVLVDPAGAPIPGVAVYWSAEKCSASSKTGSDGRFALKRIIGGLGRLCVSAGGGVTMEVYAGPPPVGEQRFVFSLSTLRGRVIRENGDPAWGLVHVYPGKSTGFLSVIGCPPVSTRRDGTFELRLASGNWFVRIFAEGRTQQTQLAEVDLSAPGTLVDNVFYLGVEGK